MNRNLCALILAASAAVVTASLADVVTLKNGDKLTGKVGTIAGGKLSFTHDQLGDMSIDLANVLSYATDEPAKIQTKTGVVKDKISEGDATKVTTAGGQTINTADVRNINPPPTKWTGSIAVNFNLQRGNTDNFTTGVDAIASLRRDDVEAGLNDRFTVGGAYNFGTSGRSDSTVTNTDNWLAAGKYDKFFNEKLYGYLGVKVEHDRVALLNYRIAPGLGVGYQWFESPEMNFSTEAGISYVFEDYNDDKSTPEDDGFNNEHVALRLAYHFDKKLNEKVSFFHNLEYLPAFDDPGDYNLTTDAGIRAMLSKSFFAQAKFIWKRDSTPAANSLENDLQYLLGLGWTF